MRKQYANGLRTRIQQAVSPQTLEQVAQNCGLSLGTVMNLASRSSSRFPEKAHISGHYFSWPRDWALIRAGLFSETNEPHRFRWGSFGLGERSALISAGGLPAD